MNNLRRTFRALLARAKASRTSEHSTDYQVLEEAAGGLEGEYRRIVTEHLLRWGVPEDCATVEVRGDGQAKGREGFVAIVTVQAWDREPVLRLLLGLPLLEKKIRKSLESGWVADVSRFEGLLLRTSQALQGREPTQQLRHLLVSLTGQRVSHREAEDEGQGLRH
jgi:hypothetical protein